MLTAPFHDTQDQSYKTPSTYCSWKYSKKVSLEYVLLTKTNKTMKSFSRAELWGIQHMAPLHHLFYTGGAQQGQALVSWVLTLSILDFCSHLTCGVNFTTEPTFKPLTHAGLWQGTQHSEERTRFRCNDSERIMVSFCGGRRSVSQRAHIRGSLVSAFTWALKLPASGDPTPPGLRPLPRMIETIRPPAQWQALCFHFNYGCWW